MQDFGSKFTYPCIVLRSKIRDPLLSKAWGKTLWKIHRLWCQGYPVPLRYYSSIFWASSVLFCLWNFTPPTPALRYFRFGRSGVSNDGQNPVCSKTLGMWHVPRAASASNFLSCNSFSTAKQLVQPHMDIDGTTYSGQLFSISLVSLNIS